MFTKAYVLLSGGLDSCLAAKLLTEQNIEVIGVHFTSPFFNNSEIIEKVAVELKINTQIIDITHEQIGLIKNPKYGFGKNFNPCIDCHSFMIKKTGQLLKKNENSFIATGEVLGQRPMSQNSKSLKIVEKHSGYEKLILRPLSAKRLAVTIPEENGWVNRELLLNIEGRSRKIQLKLAQQFNLQNYSKPGGGCRLTDPEFSKKLNKLKEMDLLDNAEIINALKFGRSVIINDTSLIIIARNENEGKILLNFEYSLKINGNETAGPVIIGFGNFNELEIKFIADIFSFYSKVKGEKEASIYINQKENIIPIINKTKVEKNLRDSMF